MHGSHLALCGWRADSVLAVGTCPGLLQEQALVCARHVARHALDLLNFAIPFKVVSSWTRREAWLALNSVLERPSVAQVRWMVVGWTQPAAGARLHICSPCSVTEGCNVLSVCICYTWLCLRAEAVAYGASCICSTLAVAHGRDVRFNWALP